MNILMNKPKTKHTSTATRTALRVGMIAAAAAATYFLYGSKNAAKNRTEVKAWSLKAKREVLKQLEGLSRVNEKAYDTIIKEVSARYQKLKKLDPKEVVAFGQELRRHWKDIEKQIPTSARFPKRSVKKAKRNGARRSLKK